MTTWSAVCLLCLSFAASASHMPVRGLWRPAEPGDTPAKVLNEARHGGLTAFRPDSMHAFIGHGSGAWIVLRPQPPWSDALHRVVSIRSMPFEPVTLYDADGALYTTSMSSDSRRLSGFGRVAVDLPPGQAGSAPILLRLPPSSSLHQPISMTLQTRPDFRQSSMRWLAWASISFGVMLAMGAMALCFALMLRDATFAWYAGYIAAYTVVQMVQTGFFFVPMGWDWLQGGAQVAGSVALSLALVCAGMFMLRFCDLKKHAPVLHLLTLAMIGYIALVALMRATGVGLLVELAQSMINPLLMLGTGVMLISALVAALRSSRSSWFFLAGWAPLLIATALASAQSSGALPDMVWLNDAGIPIAAIEAVVLSFGMADRALTIRRDRDHARELADRDSLTGVLNRRAWIEEVQKRLSAAQRHPQALLFMDLDHFKMLNDQLGHAAGDRALVSVAKALQVELRPTDVLGRYGGEEFVVLLDGTSPQDAMQIATRLRRRVHRQETPIARDDRQLTVSIGVAFARPEDSIGDLVERADKAMYAAKENGRDKVMSEAHKARLRQSGNDSKPEDPARGTRAPELTVMPEVWRAHAVGMVPRRDDEID